MNTQNLVEKIVNKGSKPPISPTQNPFRRMFEKTKDATTRVQLSLRIFQQTHERLKELQQATDAGSVNDVVLNSIQFYDEVFREYESGNDVSLLVHTGDGECIKYDLFAK